MTKKSLSVKRQAYILRKYPDHLYYEFYVLRESYNAHVGRQSNIDPVRNLFTACYEVFEVSPAIHSDTDSITLMYEIQNLFKMTPGTDDPLAILNMCYDNIKTLLDQYSDSPLAKQIVSLC